MLTDELKNISRIEHPRHRSIANFLVSTFAAIAAYCNSLKKPSLNIVPVHDNQLALF